MLDKIEKQVETHRKESTRWWDEITKHARASMGKVSSEASKITGVVSKMLILLVVIIIACCVVTGISYLFSGMSKQE